MTALVVDVGVAQPLDLRVGPDLQVGRLRDRWRTTLWAPYAAIAGRAARRQIRTTMILRPRANDPDPVEVELDVAIDEDLFEELVDVYAVYGWPALAALWRARARLTRITQELLGASIAMLDDAIANTLVSLQGSATMLAQSELRTVRDYVDAALARFTWNAAYREAELVGIPRVDKDALYTAFAKLVSARRAAEGPSADVRERERKDGGDLAKIRRARARDEYRRLLAAMQESKLRVHLDKIEALQDEIGTIFPPALLIVEELGSDLDQRLTSDRALHESRTYVLRASREVEHRYDTKIYAALHELARRLDAVATSLGNPGIEPAIGRLRALSLEERLASGGAHGAVIALVTAPEPGTATAVFESAVTFLGVPLDARARDRYAQTNRVLGRSTQLRRLLAHVEVAMPRTFHHAVLRQYCLDLEYGLDLLRADEAYWASLWHALEIGVSAAGLLLAVASIPFGAGAVGVPAAVSGFLAVSGFTMALLGVAVAVHGILGLVGDVQAGGARLRDELVQMGRLDPDALHALGETLSRHHAAFEAVTTGLVQTLAEMVVSHKIHAINWALDMKGYLDDIEALQDAPS